MTRWTVALVLTLLIASSEQAEPTAGRTDGPEGSEIGTGGYANWRTPGSSYVEGYFGAAGVDVEVDNGPNNSETELLSGVNGGYLIEDWLAFQLGFGHIGGDLNVNLFTAGMRNSVELEPFNYFFSFDAELYSPDVGDGHFGIVPGVGAEMVLNKHLRVGLRFQHDFIFADNTIGINRFTARVQFKF